MAPEIRETWENGALPRLHEALEAFETIDEIERQFADTLGQFAETMRSVRESRSHYRLVEQAKAYMERHFTDPNLSLEWLGEKFGMNGKYLSKLFKEAFGMKFVDFLIDLRLDYAKKLLMETDWSVQEIAEKIGYSSPVSFIRMFKKAVGVSPGDYRKGK
jgi:YesN/AraC family two-component response regulator